MKRLVFTSILLIFLNSVGRICAHDEVHEIQMTSKGFVPNEIEIEKGETVTFINADSQAHWPASDIHPTHGIYPEFDPKKGIAAGDSWEFTFGKAGVWRMHDHLFPSFTGLITVNDNGKATGEALEKLEESSSDSRNFFQKSWDEAKITVSKLYYKLFPAKINEINLNRNIDDPQNVEFYLKVLGPEATMQRLLTESGSGSIFDCHRQAHIIGRQAYQIYGAEVFSKGDASCHSGFYHGAMEAFLARVGTLDLAKKIDMICKKFNTSFGNFECLHGVGHGVMAYEDYDMPKALSLCRQLEGYFAQSSCYGGVFMENIVASQGGGATAHTTTWVSEDPLFPCDKVDTDQNIQEQCYMMQTSRMLDLYRRDFAKVAVSCEDAPQAYISTCFKSMGRDAAGLTLRDITKIKPICEMAPYNRWDCYWGALNVVIDFWGEKLTNQADDFCANIPDYETACLLEVESRKKDIFAKS